MPQRVTGPELHVMNVCDWALPGGPPLHATSVFDITDVCTNQHHENARVFMRFARTRTRGPIVQFLTMNHEHHPVSWVHYVVHDIRNGLAPGSDDQKSMRYHLGVLAQTLGVTEEHLHSLILENAPAA